MNKNIEDFPENIKIREKMLKKGFDIYCKDCYIFYKTSDFVNEKGELEPPICADCFEPLKSIKKSLKGGKNESK